jgi:endonuclease/exonuclease/phosphatase family metal-dependent hydrolase
MRPILVLLAFSTAILAACGGTDPALTSDMAPAATTASVTPVRFATYNVSLYSDEVGGVIRRLEADDADARNVAAVIQHLRPDVLLLNEFDFDAEGRAADLFQQRYLAQPQSGNAPISYPHRYFAPVNTGVPSGLDLDNDGRSDTGNDAWGYGRHPGQYGMLVLSQFPIDAAHARSFQHLRWAALPGARRPLNPDGTPFHADAIWEQLRLSSKSHWDLPIATPLGTVHFLVSHPTPPVFDGPEDRNGQRNFDEIRLWAEYITPGAKPWLCDDAGRCGGLSAGARFVIAGDQNADPQDGDGAAGAIAQLLDHVAVQADFVPKSEGGAARAAAHGMPRKGDTRTHTGDFGPRAGTLRLDYVLPSRGLSVRDGGVFWPISPPEHVTWSAASDHHLVWLDLEAASANEGVTP